MNAQNRFLLDLIQFARKQGVSPTQLCKLSGLSLQALEKGPAPEMSQVEHLWRNALRLSGNPCLGLQLGEEVNLMALGIVGQVIQHSATIGEALEHACQYVGLLTDAFQMQVVKKKTTFSVRILPSPTCAELYPVAMQQNIDLALACTLKEYQALCLGNVRPLKTAFHRHRPDDSHQYERVFQSELLFGQPHSEITFSNELLDHKIVTADYALLQLLITHANQLTEQYQQTVGFAAQVKQSLVSRTHLQAPQITDVAASFNLSVRSLQRRLKAEGITFQELADEVRKELALHYLKQAHHRIKEISYILGYNEVSAFSRSFKRWMGMSPGEFRDGLGVGSGFG
jgi:AraC-like DNA-binding protein